MTFVIWNVTPCVLVVSHQHYYGLPPTFRENFFGTPYCVPSIYGRLVGDLITIVQSFKLSVRNVLAGHFDTEAQGTTTLLFLSLAMVFQVLLTLW